MKISDISAAVLCGGLATRLGPAADGQPKALVDVAGRPFVDRQLGLLRRQGLSRVVLLVGHLGPRIAAHVGDGSAFGLDVRCLEDGPRLLGTGGALRQASPLLGGLFFVVYGDSYTEIDFGGLVAALEREPRADAVMAVLRNEGRWDTSNVVFRDGRLLRYDKRARTPDMDHIDYGVALLRAGALARVPAGQACDLGDLYRDLVAEGRMIGHPVFRRFWEIGSPAALDEVRRHFEENDARMTHAHTFLAEAAEVAARLDRDAVERLASLLADLRRRGGRLFVLGVGGSAGNASHAVNDFRKLCHIEAYAPTDNVSELTARTNDDGWERVFADWLRVSRLRAEDMVFVFSVGGGDLERNVSPHRVRALEYAREVGAAIGGVVGRDGGHTARVADACVIVPTVNATNVTPHTEAFQAVVWHCLVSHPALQAQATKWESLR
jgi:D-sedoheptulose 7-phosphate isomerase